MSGMENAGRRSFGQSALIGTLELKRCYHRNLMTAIFVVIGVAAVICLVAFVIFAPTEETHGPKSVAAIDATTIGRNIVPPPTVEREIRLTVEPPPPIEDLRALGTDFDVVNDTEFVEFEPVMLSQDDLRRSIGDGAAGGVGGGIDLGTASEYIPPPDTFIAVTTWPTLLKQVQPRYPNIARKAGIEGSVWVKVYVGEDGSVLKTIVARESGASAGFEEAALAAAEKCIWSPAMQNNQPVKVWMSYEIKFQLRDK